MSAEKVFVQQFARVFQHYQAALSPEVEGTNETLPAAWSSLPPEERSRMLEAARLAILELETNDGLREDSRKYFAKPGEAEWGC